MSNILLFLIWIELTGAGVKIRHYIKKHRKQTRIVIALGYAILLAKGLL